MKSKKMDLSDICKVREQLGQNQTVFWKRFGVTQSGGSRYESGRPIPRPAKILMQLYFDGKVSDDDLALALKAIAKR